MFKILVVEDDPSIQALVTRGLQKAGLQTMVAGNGAEALELHRSYRADLIVLDLMMPVMDGFALLQALRPADQVPVLMLTAMGQETKRIRGFELGADDYLVKPFSARELVARIRAILKRTVRQGVARFLRSGPFRLDRMAKRLERDGVPVPLTGLERHILDVLMSRPGEAVSRVEILNLAWPAEGRPASPRTVDVHIVSLRKKLSAEGDPSWITSFGSHGYGWSEPVEDALEANPVGD